MARTLMQETALDIAEHLNSDLMRYIRQEMYPALPCDDVIDAVATERLAPLIEKHLTLYRDQLRLQWVALAASSLDVQVLARLAASPVRSEQSAP